MTELRVDTIDRYYKPVKKFEKTSQVLFWVNVIISLSLLFIKDYPSIEIWVNGIFITATITYGLVSLYLGLLALPNAESHRSTHLIADSLGVTLDNETTNKYYNNKQAPSLMRLGMNVFENSLFSWTITSRMLITARRKVGTWGLLLFLLLLLRNSPLELICVIAQTIFATSLLSDFFRLEIAKYQFHRVFRESWSLFLGGIPADNQSTHGVILNLANRYEAIKARMTVSIDTKVFNEINAETSEEWERIKVKLKLE